MYNVSFVFNKLLRHEIIEIYVSVIVDCVPSNFFVLKEIIMQWYDSNILNATDIKKVFNFLIEMFQLLFFRFLCDSEDQ